MFCIRRWGSSFAALTFLRFSFASHPAKAQLPFSTGAITGRIADLQTGESIAKAAISVVDQPSVTTGDDGRFTLTNVPAGAPELRNLTVGYGLLKKKVALAAGATIELDLRLGQD